jgi:hypothetical protein
MSRVFMVLAACALLAGESVAAQTVVIQQRPGVPETKNEVRVQVNVSFFVPGAVNGTDASLKTQEQARRSLYETEGKRKVRPVIRLFLVSLAPHWHQLF